MKERVNYKKKRIMHTLRKTTQQLFYDVVNKLLSRNKSDRWTEKKMSPK